MSAKEAVQGFQANVTRSVYERIDKKTEGTEARKICDEEIEFFLRSFSEECERLIVPEVNAWIENIGTSIKNATEYTIARIGLRATSEVSISAK